MRRISTVLYLFAFCILIFVVCKDNSVSTGGSSNTNETLIFSFDSISSRQNPFFQDTIHYFSDTSIHKIKITFSLSTNDTTSYSLMGHSKVYVICDSEFIQYSVDTTLWDNQNNVNFDCTYNLIFRNQAVLHCLVSTSGNPNFYIKMKSFKLYRIS